jgi:predicted nucleic acid-binding protein
MTAAFADTFFWIVLTNRLDQANESAKTYARTMPRLLTTEEVLTEYLNHFSGKGLHLRQRAASRVQLLFENSTVTILPNRRRHFEQDSISIPDEWIRDTA